jgi:GT2 family glycosyltransferase
MNDQPLVSIVIVNYNGIAYLKSLFDSLSKNTYLNLEIIFVDNCSGDESVRFVEQNYPDTKILKNPENYMFARGNNEGIKIATGKYVCLLNNDTETHPNFIEPVVSFLEINENYGAAQPKILDINKKEKLEYAGACGGYLDFFGYPFLRGRLFDHVEIDAGQYDEASQIFWASGACSFFRQDALISSGLFDEDFQLHMEEIDLCWRLQLNGWKIASIPKAKIYHHGGGTLSQFSPQKVYYNFRNNIFLIFKNFSLINLLVRFPMRIALDFIALLRSVLVAEFAMALAIARAYIWILLHIRLLIRKRLEVQKNRVLKDKAVLQIMYPGSIVFEFFILKKTKFVDLLFYRNFIKRIRTNSWIMTTS